MYPLRFPVTQRRVPSRRAPPLPHIHAANRTPRCSARAPAKRAGSFCRRNAVPHKARCSVSQAKANVGSDKDVFFLGGPRGVPYTKTTPRFLWLGHQARYPCCMMWMPVVKYRITKQNIGVPSPFSVAFKGKPNGQNGEPQLVPSLPLTWHLWEGTWKMNFLLKGPLVNCLVSGREMKVWRCLFVSMCSPCEFKAVEHITGSVRPLGRLLKGHLPQSPPYFIILGLSIATHPHVHS